MIYIYYITKLFVLALIIVGIFYFFKKNTFEYFFLPVYFFLPNFFALEINDTLPLLSVKRMLLLVFFLYTFLYFRKQPVTFRSKPLLCYFILRIISNSYYIFALSSSRKAIFSILIEELLLLIAFLKVFSTKEKIRKALDIFIHVSSAMFVLGIIESYTRIDFSQAFYTVNRAIVNDYYIRLGLLRAKCTFGLPSLFAVFCLMMIFAIHYFYTSTGNKKYLVFLGFDILCLIHTGSRAQVLLLLPVLFLLCSKNFSMKKLFLFCSKKFSTNQKSIVRDYLTMLLMVVLFMVLASAISPYARYFYSGTVKSCLNEIGFSFDLDANAPKGVTGFGKNSESGSYTRLSELSGIPYALSKNPLFGLGYAAQNRGVQYLYKGNWNTYYTCDVFYVSVLMSEGIIGFIAYIFLLITIITQIRLLPPCSKKLALEALCTFLLCLFSVNL